MQLLTVGGSDEQSITRRQALARVAILCLGGLGVVPAGRQLQGDEAGGGCSDHDPRKAGDPVGHPDPRPGVTGDRVLPADQVAEDAREAYEWAREIPGVLDGIYCHCECAERDGLRSLLECFETRMAVTCGICRAQVRLAYEMHHEGKTLEQIRAAVDKRYGD